MPFILLFFSTISTLFFAKRMITCTWNFNAVKYGPIHPQLKRKYIKEAHPYIRLYAILLAGSTSLIILSIYLLFQL